MNFNSTVVDGFGSPYYVFVVIIYVKLWLNATISQKNNQFTQITTMRSCVVWKINLFLSSSFEYWVVPFCQWICDRFLRVFIAFSCLDLNTDRKLSIRALYRMKSFLFRKNKNFWINVILFKLFCLWYFLLPFLWVVFHESFRNLIETIRNFFLFVPNKFRVIAWIRLVNTSMT